MHRDTEHLTALAGRCDKAAEQLTYEAEHAAEVLADRAGGSQVDPNQWAADKRAAADAARQYAAGLRTEAAELGEYDRPSKERIAQAEKVALGAEMGGILIDGQPMAEATATDPGAHVWAPATKEAWESGTHPAQTKAVDVEGSGQFEHVADDGVPFWQLRGDTNQATSTPAAHDASTADDGDEF